jgi:N-acetylmuramoyl-L-alanine amidase
MMIMAKLKYLVIHCTATPEGREVSSADIRKWHTSPVAQGGRGWKQVGYTDLFHLNGGVERLVENNEDAQVDPWEATPELVRAINKYQDLYITEQMGIK